MGLELENGGILERIEKRLVELEKRIGERTDALEHRVIARLDRIDAGLAFLEQTLLAPGERPKAPAPPT